VTAVECSIECPRARARSRRKHSLVQAVRIGCLDRACEGIIAYQPPTRMVGAETDGVPVRDDGLELFLIDLATGHQQSHFLLQEYGGRGVKKMRG